MAMATSIVAEVSLGVPFQSLADDRGGQ